MRKETVAGTGGDQMMIDDNDVVPGGWVEGSRVGRVMCGWEAKLIRPCKCDNLYGNIPATCAIYRALQACELYSGMYLHTGTIVN